MKIAEIDVYQVDLPYSGGTYRLSGGREYTSFDATIVRLTADDGTTGWGESTPAWPTEKLVSSSSPTPTVALPSNPRSV